MLLRHVPKQYAEAMKATCRYCRKTPPMWHIVGDEKVCAYCGTRVYAPRPAQADERVDAQPSQA